MSGGRPVGTGKSADKVMAVLRGLGTDKEFRPIAIRTPELSQRTGITPNNLARVMNALVEAGQVTRCQVSQPGRGAPVNEYRLGAGMAHHVAPPLNPKRHGIAHGAPTKPLPVTTPAPAVSTPRTPVTEIEVPVLRHAQPAVAQNSGSRPIGKSTTTPSPEAPAVAAPAGDVLRISLDDDGTLLLFHEDGVLEMGIDQVMRLGDFLHQTQGVWRP